MTVPIRMLILLGMVLFTAVLGSVPDQLLADKPDETPAHFAVTANNELAFDLYKQLAREGNDKPVFFSPYSIVNCAGDRGRGACNETADEMGKVLRFPPATRCGDSNPAQPWDLGLIHPGLVR